MSDKPKVSIKQYLAVNRLRQTFLSQFGATHLTGTKHSKAWADYGYSVTLDFLFFLQMYRRIGIARAVVDRPVDMCWLTNPMIKRTQGKKDIEDEAHAELAERLELWPNLADLDRMQAVGHYAGLIIRVADGLTPDRPLGRISADDIKAVMPAWEGQLTPGTIDNDPASDRYGLPVTYTYHQRQVSQQGQRDGNDSFTVHHSRVIIWNEGAAGNTIYGTSRLEPCYNAIIDFEKIRGAGGEGFWRSAAQRHVLKAMADTAGQMPQPDELDSLNETLLDMFAGMDSVPFLGGMEIQPLSNTMTEPKGYIEAALFDIAAGAKWSAKGLVGAQTGVLAGDEDSRNDRITAQARRESYLKRMIKRWLQWLDFYTTDFNANGLFVEWDDLASPSDTERFDNAKKLWDMRDQLTGERAFTIDEVRDVAGYESNDDLTDFDDEASELDDVPDNQQP